jgi:hypothetical protein
METGCRFLPLGRDEKLYLEIVGEKSPFAPETHVLGDPRDVRTGVYYIRRTHPAKTPALAITG